MLPKIEVSDDDFAYAESILLPEGKTFDGERRRFITDFTTLDLQAVPGSGKTTAILAKLLILERNLPLKGGVGILIISHTNVAVDEIKDKLKAHCPKLFNYPNFIGTIQNFVDEFLAFPYYALRFKKRIVRIDNEIYDETINRLFRFNISGFAAKDQSNARHFLTANLYTNKYRFNLIDGKVQLTDGINGNQLEITKPGRNTRNYRDFTNEEKQRIKKWLFHLKKRSLEEEGVLHFDDAYFLADCYLQTFPAIKDILRHRFALIIADEMQDMDRHQYNLLEELFYDDGRCYSIYQRIGDKNQAIFNGKSKLEHIWTDRANLLPLSGSQRLTQPVASLIRNFALFQSSGFVIKGLNAGKLNPYIIKYASDRISEVPQCFLDLISELQKKGEFPSRPAKPIKIIGWNTEWENGTSQPGKVRLIDYYPKFSRSKHRPTIDFDCLESYLLACDLSSHTVAPIRRNILNILLKILRLEGAKTNEGLRFSKHSMIEFLKSGRTNAVSSYDIFNQNIFNCVAFILKDELNEASQQLHSYIPSFLDNFSLTINKSKEFVVGKPSSSNDLEATNDSMANVLSVNNIPVDITTIHSVKGQTLSAVLYLETSYNGKHESEYLCGQFLGNPFCDTRVRHKEATKMAYVGLSRAENLLCIAIQEDRCDTLLKDIDHKQWEIITLTSN